MSLGAVGGGAGAVRSNANVGSVASPSTQSPAAAAGGIAKDTFGDKPDKLTQVLADRMSGQSPELSFKDAYKNFQQDFKGLPDKDQAQIKQGAGEMYSGTLKEAGKEGVNLTQDQKDHIAMQAEMTAAQSLVEGHGTNASSADAKVYGDLIDMGAMDSDHSKVDNGKREGDSILQ